MQSFPPVCLTIGATDASGGSGVAADLKTFTALNVYGSLAVTAVEARGFSKTATSFPVSEQAVRQQLDSVMAQLPVSVIKVGICPTSSVVRAVGRFLREHTGLKVVVDPVATDSRGIALLQPEVVSAMRKELLPRATVATPNRFEAALLAGMEECLSIEDMEQAARTICQRHGCPVLVTGGGLGGRSTDVLCGLDGISHYDAPAVPRSKVYGAGCAHSAAIAAGLAKGDSLRESILHAKMYISAAIGAAPSLPDGHALIWHGVTVREQVIVADRRKTAT